MISHRKAVFLITIFVLGVALHSPYIVTIAVSLLVILGVANWWQSHSLDGISYHRRFHYTRGFPGEHYPVRIEITNNKLLPVSWLRTQDPWPKAVGPDDQDLLAPSHIDEQGFLTNVMSLRWYERFQRNISIHFQKRGVYKVGPVLFDSGDLFGIYKQNREIGLEESLTVFPKLIPFSRLDSIAEDPFGDQRRQRSLFEDPNRPMGVREYHPEDGFRRVHWPATARTGQLHVKVYQPIAAQVVTICLNVATFPHPWEGYHAGKMEHLVSLAATLVYQGLQAGYQVGLLSNGCLSNSDQPFRIPPGRSPKQLSHLLQALAGVTPLVITSFENFLLKEVPNIPYGAMLVVLTAMTSPSLAETLLRLKKHERKIILISTAPDTLDLIPGIRLIHLPYQDIEV